MVVLDFGFEIWSGFCDRRERARVLTYMCGVRKERRLNRIERRHDIGPFVP